MTNLNVNKKVIREAGDSHPPVEDELSLCGGSDLDEQIMMNWNLEEVMKMISSKILLATLMQWKKQVHQEGKNWLV